MDVDNDAGGGTGSARRQREGRLRQFLRYERLSVAMALSEFFAPYLEGSEEGQGR